ncbi:MAG TPA: hypothetical protein ENL10_03995, partial [Candidatus Cloacimonetes bacterium]|nr:hypothetical protein [Candidatus Cloacimonadota bacterium]
RDLSISLGNARKLLASEGILMMLEVTNSPVYLDFIFGMTEGWWLYEDIDIRTEHATMPPDKWKTVLESNGYTDVACYSDFPENNVSCQTVVMARAEKLNIEANESDNEAKLAAGNWLVFTDHNGVSDKVIDHFKTLNKSCTTVEIGERYEEVADDKFTIDALSQDDVDKVLDFINRRGNFEGIIYAWGLDLLDRGLLSVETIEQGESQGTIMIMNIMKKLNETQYKKNPGIWVLLSGSQTVAGSPELINLSQEGLRGVSRCIVNEFPNYITTVVDFNDPVQDYEIEVFIDEIFAEDRVDELAFRGKKRYVNKLERISTDNIAQRAMKSVQAEGSPYTATISEYGVLDNIVLRETDKKTPASDQVEITVKASALNFRDIMIAMGLLSDEAVEGGLFGRTFGLECSGVVSAVGSDVTTLRVGDEVMATAPSCLGGFAYPMEVHCVKKPKNIDWNEAAGLPVVYTTAYFSLVHHCRLQKGEHVLIHAAAGGVGIAAINIANVIGAE